MQYTLHLTQSTGEPMSPTTALQVRRLASPGSVLTFLSVVHGLVPAAEDTVAEAVCTTIRAVVEDTGSSLFYRMITDDVGLDTAFLSYATSHHIDITFAWDAVSSLQKAEMLLHHQPYAAVILTVTPETLPHFADNVKALFAMGFRYLYTAMDPGSPWENTHLPQLKRQYRALSSFYREKSRREEKLYLSPFDEKIADRIRQRPIQCTLGQSHLSVTPDGKLYPCAALCEDAYCIGNLEHGIDTVKRDQLCAANEQEAAECVGCAIHARCVHHCACINKCATGSITSPSPFQCAHERILLPIADSLAERLYHERNALFMQKHYNTLYPTLSLAEDK